MSFFPKIDEANITAIQLVLRNLSNDPAYLSDKACKYSETVRDFLQTMADGQAGGASEDLFEGDKNEALDREIELLINDMKAHGQKLGPKDHAERMSYFRTMTSLLEKLVSMRERTLNLKNLSEFQSIILGFMEEIMSKDQISDLRDRLKNVSIEGK